jgi:hypothetical protein
MLTVYCDASGSEGDPATFGVGGYIASVESWLRFDATWRGLLAHNQLEYFRMAEFAHSTGQFVAWKGDEKRRKEFLEKLIAVINSHCSISIGVFVALEEYGLVNQVHLLNEFMPPYVLCALSCIKKAREYRDRHHPGESLELVFETGDLHAGMLVGWTQFMYGTAPSFKGKREATPLQAADFIAYEQRLGVLNQMLGGNVMVRFRKSFQRLLELRFDHGIYREMDLRVLCRSTYLPLREPNRQG